jgi:hypothetical protein
MTQISWTEKARADVAPRDASSVQDFDVAVVWQKTRRSFAAVRALFEKGVEYPGAAREATRGLLDLLAQEALPANANTVALGAALRVMEQFVEGRVDALVLAIGKTCGPAAALDAVIEAHAFRVVVQHPGQWLESGANASAYAVHPLRLAILKYGDEAAVKLARARWPSLPVGVKVTLAYALSSAPDLAADAAREIGELPAKTKLVVAPVLASLKDATHLEAMLSHRQGAWPLVDAVENLGEAALPAFLALWKKPIHDRLHLARATSCFEDERVAKIFAGELGKKTTRDIAREYMLRFPELAEPALASLADTRSAVGALAADVRDQAQRLGKTHDEAPLADLPMVLSDPPWMRRKPQRSVIRHEIAPRERAQTVQLAPAIRSAITSQLVLESYPPASEEDVRAWASQVREGKDAVAWRVPGGRVPKELVIELAKSVGLASTTDASFPFQLVAVFGDEAVPAFAAYAKQQWDRIGTYVTDYKTSAHGHVILGVDSHVLAAAMIGSLDEKRASRTVWRWYETHPEAAIAGLLPIAVGDRGAPRFAAERVLRKLARRDADAVRAEARELGVLDSLEEILAWDERWVCPLRAPKMPASWKPETFTRPLLLDGRALPLEAVERIGHMLAFSTPDEPYVGLEDVKRACDPRTLAELAWDTARAWETSNARNADVWMLESIAWLGDDEVIRRTTPAIKHPHIVDVLGYAATDAAAMELCTIARRIDRSKEGWFRQRHWGDQAGVERALADLARRRAISMEDLEDSLKPAHAFELHLTLDYGARKLEVGFDERLDPYVEGPKGKLRDLPKAGKNDDPDKVARAQEIWAELQEDVAAIADVRLGSLERAMVSGRTWSPDAFRRAWMEHPFMRHLSRGVVWCASGKSFRIAEDGSFADASDAAFETRDRIGIVHPADMAADERAAWQRVFADYRIAQPIVQLDRVVVPRFQGGTLALVPSQPATLAEMHERIRLRGFILAWRNREQIATRACMRSLHRLVVTLKPEGQKVIAAPLSIDGGGDLARVHAVDISEVVHDLGLVVA